VVSVGNLHWGGGGKTPLTIALAAHLSDRGRRVAVLSRGYGGARREPVAVVSAGSGPLLEPRIAGDEPFLMAESLPGVAVLVGPDRHAAGLHALAHLSPAPDVFVLDDGFSHLGLARDVDLLLFPAADPFAGGRLAPSGRLREPLAAAACADAVLLTDAPHARAGVELAAALAPHGYRGPAFASTTCPAPVRDAEGRAMPEGARAFLAAGIARPTAFFALAERAGLTIAGRMPFADHAPFDAEQVTRLEDVADAGGAQWLVVTGKDEVKLRGRTRLPLGALAIRAEPEPAFWSWLDERLDRVSARGKAS
jgi:tetraacyldisaccharide 4'-kinase